MKPKDRIKVLNSTKQSSIRKFDSPPGPKVGREGDLGVAVIPKKGLHLFYKLGGKWHGVRLKNVFNTEADDRKIIIPSNSLNPKNGELFFENNDIKVKLDDDNSFTIGQAITKINRDVNDGNPVFQMGSSDTENFQIITNYNGGAKGIDKVQFITATGSSAANKGAYEFYVDGTNSASDLKLMIDDGGIHVYNPITANEIQTDSGDLTLDSGADIDLQAEGGDITFKGGSDAALATINSSGLTINNISSGDGSGENFLVEEGGVVKKRSAAETLSDIGALTSFTVAATTNTNPSTITQGDTLTIAAGNGLTTTATSDGTITIASMLMSALVNYVNKVTAQAISGTKTFVKTHTTTSSDDIYPFKSEINHSGNTGSGQTIRNYGSNIDINYTGSSQNYSTTENYGVNFTVDSVPSGDAHGNFNTTIRNFGIKGALTGTTDGSHNQTGLDLTITGADLNSQTGILLNTQDGSTDLKIVSSANNDDYFTIATTTNGATTLTTENDAGGIAAHLLLDADGDITLDAASGNIYVKNNGGNYTPGSDYEIATKKYVDDNAGGGGGLNPIISAMVFG